jgi:16S rRNA (guanine(966)-N(2))-methyltransferase RsmD
MRITTGTFRSRIIKYPKHIRPTQDKIRKSLFDILRGVLAQSRFLELFAGSGAVGIEALSNGAKEVVFVEEDRRCAKIIEENLNNLGLTARGASIELLIQDAFRAIDFLEKQGRRFDIIFLDPPYYKDLAPRFRSGSTTTAMSESLTKKALQKISACDILAPHALVVVEHAQQDEIGETFLSLTCFKQRRYADKVLSFYEKGNIPR